MPTISDSIIINADAQKVFDISQDYNIRLKWDPYLAKAEILGPTALIEPGTKVYCENKKGTGMTVEYVTFNRPFQTAIKLYGNFPFIRNFAGSWNFRAAGTNKTEVTFKYHFEAKSTILKWFIEYYVSKMLIRDIRNRLNGLKEFIDG